MRVTLKHLLPLALILTPILAADKTTTADAVATTDESKQTTATDATNTDEGTATATATDETGTTATGTADEKSTKKNTKSGKATTATTATTAVDTFSWNPTVPATTAPDLNAAGMSVQSRGAMGLSVAFGLVTLGVAYL
ncbi:Fc.00g028680.m01.CDS01 [Cosmosporella sp. VM-42]